MLSIWVSKEAELWPISTILSQELERFESSRKSTNNRRHSREGTVYKGLPPRYRIFFPPTHVVLNLFTREAYGEISFVGVVNLENDAPCFVSAAN